MTKKTMQGYAKNWKSPEERREAKRNSADSKGPGPNDWKKGATKKPKGC